MIKNILHQYKLIIFDLDNTLYSEDDFLFQSYSYVCQYVSRKIGLDYNALYQTICDVYFKEGRKELFQKFILKYNLRMISSGELLVVMRSIKKINLKLFDWVLPCFDYLRKNSINIAVCTNGNVEQQMRKAKALKLSHMNIVYANQYQPKPSPISIEIILKNYPCIQRQQVLFVGDSKIDYLTAENSRIQFMHVYKWRACYEIA